MWERTQADGKNICGLQKHDARGTRSYRYTGSENSRLLIVRVYSLISLLFNMKHPSDQEENIVGKALCELIKIFNEIDLDSKNAEKGSPDEMVIKRGRKKIRVKL